VRVAFALAFVALAAGCPDPKMPSGPPPEYEDPPPPTWWDAGTPSPIDAGVE
jgi:hypothetical protein